MFVTQKSYVFQKKGYCLTECRKANDVVDDDNEKWKFHLSSDSNKQWQQYCKLKKYTKEFIIIITSCYFYQHSKDLVYVFYRFFDRQIFSISYFKHLVFFLLLSWHFFHTINLLSLYLYLFFLLNEKRRLIAHVCWRVHMYVCVDLNLNGHKSGGPHSHFQTFCDICKFLYQSIDFWLNVYLYWMGLNKQHEHRILCDRTNERDVILQCGIQTCSSMFPH